MAAPSPSRSGGQMHAFGRDDGGAAAAAQRALQRRVGRHGGDLLLRQPAGGVDDEAAGFERMMADRHFHLVGEDLSHQRAGELAAMDLLVHGHERVARERVVMLPAGKRAVKSHPPIMNA